MLLLFASDTVKERGKMADGAACLKLNTFQSSLAKLKFNSKPLIDDLTKLAAENRIFADKIVLVSRLTKSY